ncbi:unnamed protein product [Lupinus luteus]|uniref:Uncharacterized protein n=1 Tax=Lupinus luteus TaxID=3873 RepID=A0AAV1Y935_LUPLU
MKITIPFDSKHVAILAFPFGTHAGPLLSMVLRIAAEYPDVRFSFFSTRASNAKTLALNKGNIQVYNVHDGFPEGHMPRHPMEAIGKFIHAMPGNFRNAIDEVVAETGMNITCLITDAFYWFGAEMAKEFDCKWVPLWTAGPHSVLVHIETDLLRERVSSKSNDVCDDPSIDFLTGLSGVKVSDLPEGVVRDIENPMATMLHRMGTTLSQATVVAMNSFTDVHPAIADLFALAEALEEYKFPFIWAFSGNPEKQMPKGFLERTKNQGKVVAWAPQNEILQHSSVGVCVTHCGWNSILECMVGGVPMICRPFFGDQKLNNKMLEHEWGIGVGIENGVFTKENTLRALELTLSSEKGRVMRQKVLELRDCALKAIEPQGSSIKDFTTLINIVTS